MAFLLRCGVEMGRVYALYMGNFSTGLCNYVGRVVQVRSAGRCVRSAVTRAEDVSRALCCPAVSRRRRRAGQV